MMTTIQTALILTIVGMLGMSACRDKPTCLDCEDTAEANDDDGIPIPDLPCGGADLMTDNLNCGTCGHECVLDYPATDYEAGACKAGQCGPVWSICLAESLDDLLKNCSDVCAALSYICVANGCSGKTGMMYNVVLGQGCGDIPPVLTLAGGCDEPIPWMTPVEYTIEVSCCCEHQ